MGKPKFSRKKYETPSHPWQADRIRTENEIVKKYGLKNKKEVWKAQTALRKYRGQARTLLAKVGSEDPQAKKESDQLIMRLTRLNVLPANSTLDDVLALETESILSRRLQTLTYLKGLASTPDQARQLISHGHIAIDGCKVTVPSYTVTKDEENEIGYTLDSSLNDTMHPARPRADFKSPIPVKKETPVEKPKEEKAVKPTEEKKDKPETPSEEPKEKKEPETTDDKIPTKDDSAEGQPKEEIKESPKQEPDKTEEKNDKKPSEEKEKDVKNNKEKGGN